MTRTVKKLLAISIFAVVYLGWNQVDRGNMSAGQVQSGADSAASADYGEWRSGQQVQGQGEVIRLLSDDNNGSRHQRFIISLSGGQTLLVAHNIDLAPRVSSLRKGDTVVFNGVYEENDRGGVIHWTHLDPQGRHTPGWIQHNGQVYQ